MNTPGNVIDPATLRVISNINVPIRQQINRSVRARNSQNPSALRFLGTPMILQDSKGRIHELYPSGIDTPDPSLEVTSHNMTEVIFNRILCSDKSDGWIDDYVKYPYMHISDFFNNPCTIKILTYRKNHTLWCSFTYNDTYTVSLINELIGAPAIHHLNTGQLIMFESNTFDERSYTGIACAEARYMWYQFVKAGFVQK
jgi:hypothetical protein